jgi:hypothetical protein
MTVAVCISAGALASCGNTEGKPLDVPRALRQRAAGEFPDFEIVGAEGVDLSEDPSLGLWMQDVTFTMRHRQLPFYLDRRYARVFRAGKARSAWTLQDTPANKVDLSFSGKLDKKTKGFIEFFSERYPSTEFLCSGVSGMRRGPNQIEFTASAYPREEPRFGCSSHESEMMICEYDEKTGAWSEWRGR